VRTARETGLCCEQQRLRVIFLRAPDMLTTRGAAESQALLLHSDMVHRGAERVNHGKVCGQLDEGGLLRLRAPPAMSGVDNN
jgi:hypothetical protein